MSQKAITISRKKQKNYLIMGGSKQEISESLEMVFFTSKAEKKTLL